MKKLKYLSLLLLLFFAAIACYYYSKFAGSTVEVNTARQIPTPQQLQRHAEYIGPPRVEQLADDLYVALSYDLANTILLRTSEGNVVIDVSGNPQRAQLVKEALREAGVSGATRMIIYTHSHIDHIGGASIWVEPDTQIWATEAFHDHLIKQYGLFGKAETRRGWRQFGKNVPAEMLPCSALGRRVDLAATMKSGVRLPTHTFSGQKILKLGEIEIHLVEAHGETHDQLFVWIPHRKALLPGDNYYHTFPNLYTIRGTRPRPVDEWIHSLDAMRRYQPEILVPSHTRPLLGSTKILSELRNYRDAIQWIRDEVVRRANRGESFATMVDEIGLPEHLVGLENLVELYGQVDWSVRAIYCNELGWFDGQAHHLYPLPHDEQARREIELMGGHERVLQVVKQASKDSEWRWAIHLLTKLRDSGQLSPEQTSVVKAQLAHCYRSLAGEIYNTNGRAYLLETAFELENPPQPIPLPQIDDELLQQIPIAVFFQLMTSRLIPEKAIASEQTVLFRITDEQQKFYLTVRKGILEVVNGEALPDTAPPRATIDVDSLTWKRIAVKKQNAAAAILDGSLQIDDKAAFLEFVGRFSTK